MLGGGTMTVGELIKLLERQPQDRRIVVAGYEEGCRDVEEVRELPLVLNAYPADQDYMGPHAAYCAELHEAPDEIAVFIAGRTVGTA